MKNTLTKESLASSLANKGYTKVEAQTIIDHVIGDFQTALVKGERVEIRGLFVITNKKTPARTARNPKTGVAVQIPERFLPRIKPSPELVAKINLK